MQNHKTLSSVGRAQSLSHYLTNSKSQEPNVTVDDELCGPHRQNIFLTASMIFLQNRLDQKLKCDDLNAVKFKSESAIKTRSSSDLLIIEKFCKHKSKKYLIRLKDIDKYDEILRQEACIPPKALSLESILPLPKKHSAILKFFKTISSNNLSQISLLNKSNAIFRFKKSEITTNKNNKILPREINDFTNNFNERCQNYIDQLPSENSLIPINYISKLKNTKSSLDKLKCNDHETNVIYKVSLYRDDYSNDTKNEISQDCPLRKSASEDINAKSKMQMDNYKVTDESTSLKKSETNLLTRCTAHTKLIKRQQSKLSVCDDYDWSYVE